MLYSTENEEKSSVVERWNRTMKNIMWKYFIANSTQKYIDVLPSIVEKYNNTCHRSIKLTPSDARNPANYQRVHNALYATVNARKATSPKFHVGDKVRITRKKGTFEKWFTPNWTELVFTISSVKAANPPTYQLSSIHLENQFRGLLRARAAIERAGNLSYWASTQEEEKSSIRQVERLKWRVQFADTINRPWSMDISKQYDWQQAENYRENNPLLPQSLSKNYSDL